MFDLSGHVIGIVSDHVTTLTSGCAPPDRGPGNCQRSLAFTSSVVQTFLDAQRVSYKTTPEPPSTREIADIAEDAKGYTFLIECNRRMSGGNLTPAPVILYNIPH
jgi:hypothetical protein